MTPPENEVQRLHGELEQAFAEIRRQGDLLAGRETALDQLSWVELGARQAALSAQLTEVRAELRRRAPEEAARRGPGHDSQLAREAGVQRQALLEWLGKRTSR